MSENTALALLHRFGALAGWACTLALALPGAAHAAAPPGPALRLEPFEAITARAVTTALAPDLDGFALQPFTPSSEVRFVFEGDSPGQEKVVRCERAASLSVVLDANEQGSVQAGVCRSASAQLEQLARRAKPALERSLEALARSLPQPEQLARLGLAWQQRTLPGGARMYSFPIIWVGHGMGWINTTVVVSPGSDRAVVVQADLLSLCERHDRVRGRWCTGRAPALGEVATALDRVVAK